MAGPGPTCRSILTARPTVAALVLAATLAISACAKDELSASELVAKGDEICRASQQRFREIQPHSPRSFAEAADQAEAAVDAEKDEISALSDLDPPDELRDDFDRYLQAKEEALALMQQGADAANDRDKQGYVDALTEEASPVAVGERIKLARAVGFKTCSQPQFGSADEGAGTSAD